MSKIYEDIDAYIPNACSHRKYFSDAIFDTMMMSESYECTYEIKFPTPVDVGKIFRPIFPRLDTSEDFPKGIFGRLLMSNTIFPTLKDVTKFLFFLVYLIFIVKNARWLSMSVVFRRL